MTYDGKDFNFCHEEPISHCFPDFKKKKRGGRVIECMYIALKSGGMRAMDVVVGNR